MKAAAGPRLTLGPNRPLGWVVGQPRLDRRSGDGAVAAGQLVRFLRHGETFAVVKTNRHGRFAIALPAGSYGLRAATNGPLRQQQFASFPSGRLEPHKALGAVRADEHAHDAKLEHLVQPEIDAAATGWSMRRFRCGPLQPPAVLVVRRDDMSASDSWAWLPTCRRAKFHGRR
jgi:hypothetical protein